MLTRGREAWSEAKQWLHSLSLSHSAHQNEGLSGVGPVPEHLILPHVHYLLRLGVHPHDAVRTNPQNDRLQFSALQHLLTWLLREEGEREEGRE